MPEGFCKRCDYSLAGVAANACPECGGPFDPLRPETYSKTPHGRRTRILKRTGWAVLILAAALILAPRRFERLEFSWFNPGYATATTQTRWELVAPSFLPFRYPHWTSRARLKQVEPGGLVVVAQTSWKLRCFWPLHPSRFVGALGGLTPGYRSIGSINNTDILPENLDKLMDLLVYGIGTGGRIVIANHAIPENPPPDTK